MNRKWSVSVWFVVIVVALVFGVKCANATNYYLSPDGDDNDPGTTMLYTPWASLYHASQTMEAGDTLFVCGGTYDDTHQQYFKLDGVDNVTIKAYGDSKAIFTKPGCYAYPGRDGQPPGNGDCFVWVGQTASQPVDSFVLDGFSYLDPTDSLYIVFDYSGVPYPGRTQRLIGIGIDGLYAAGDRTENHIIRGIEIDGSGPQHLGGGTVVNGITGRYLVNCRIESNYIHHMYWPTGDDGGDNTEREQSRGECIFLHSIRLCTIKWNRLTYAGHAALSIEMGDSKAVLNMYNTIMQNVVVPVWGGGIYLHMNSRYNLVDGNIIGPCGTTTTKTKGAFYFPCSRNSIRRNVTFCDGGGDSVGFKGIYAVGGPCCQSDSNLVYNNVFVAGLGANLILAPLGADHRDGCAEASCIGNEFYNNIFFASVGTTADQNSAYAEISLYCVNANDDHNWLDPDTEGTPASSTHWGGNIFKYNCIRKTVDGDDEDEAIAYYGDQTYSIGQSNYSIGEAISDDNVAWSRNNNRDPMLRDLTPTLADGDFALDATWWYPCKCSYMPEHGMAVVDSIGILVEAAHTGYGWGNIVVRGKPDIGAHEYLDGIPQPPPVPERYSKDPAVPVKE